MLGRLFLCVITFTLLALFPMLVAYIGLAGFALYYILVED